MQFWERKVTRHDPEGTRSQRRDGHIWVKHQGRMVKAARLAMAIREDRELDRNERVFFRDGDRENIDPRNLTSVHFQEARFKYLPRSRVIYIPGVRSGKAVPAR